MKSSAARDTTLPLTDTEVLAQIKESIPDATQANVDRWRESGDLQYRTIDGQPRYFRRAVSNLFRFSRDARRRQKSPLVEKKFDTTALVEKLVQLSEGADGPELYPVKHNVRYELAVRPANPRTSSRVRKCGPGCRSRRNTASNAM